MGEDGINRQLCVEDEQGELMVFLMLVATASCPWIPLISVKTVEITYKPVLMGGGVVGAEFVRPSLLSPK